MSSKILLTFFHSVSALPEQLIYHEKQEILAFEQLTAGLTQDRYSISKMHCIGLIQNKCNIAL